MYIYINIQNYNICDVCAKNFWDENPKIEEQNLGNTYLKFMVYSDWKRYLGRADVCVFDFPNSTFLRQALNVFDTDLLKSKPNDDQDNDHMATRVVELYTSGVVTIFWATKI